MAATMMAPASRRAGRVLVVDDNEDAADALAALLRSELDCEVFTAYDGAQALDKAGEVHPDVVVMDITMPQVDGFEAASLLRRVFRRKPPRLIAVSGTAGLKPEQAQAWGFDTLLGKPVVVEQLVEAVSGELRHAA
jgi:CheY-like chemotaxis protein